MEIAVRRVDVANSAMPLMQLATGENGSGDAAPRLTAGEWVLA